MTRATRIARAALLVGGAALVLAPPARAQAGGDGFLFRAPRAAFTIRAGMNNPSANSDLFAFTTDTLTLSRGDFEALALAAELSMSSPAPWLDLVLGVGYAGSRAPSEFRNWVEEGPTPSDDDDLPIEQTTTFQRVPLTVALKAYLAPRGREIGHFAWVPSRLSPYVGAGLGAMYYTFRQEGAFVDYRTSEVFESKFESRGWGALGQGMAGLDVTVSPRVALTADARYIHAKANVGGDFEGFEQLDLSGLTTSLGLTFRF